MLAGLTILEVDYCEAHNFAVTRILEKAGSKVLRAHTGAEAIAFSLQNPDAVLLEINLPDFNGFEVCRRLKSDPATAHIPVVFVTAGYHNAHAKAMAESVGANALLFYPVDTNQLLAVVKGQIVMANPTAIVGKLPRTMASLKLIAGGSCQEMAFSAGREDSQASFS